MRKLAEDWEFNVLDVYNYQKDGKLKYYYDFIKAHHLKVEGDIIEVGVFRGKSILATGLLLKELGSSKKVFGYDTFQGFPPIYDQKDDLNRFKDLFEANRISKLHFDQTSELREMRSFLKGFKVDVKSISSSTDFSSNNLAELERKIEYLGLDNIVLVPGEFAKTMKDLELNHPQHIMACLMDCDLYQSYVTALDFTWGRLSKAGYIFLDEYFSLKFPGARIATDEFCQKHGVSPSLHPKTRGEFERWGLYKP